MSCAVLHVDLQEAPDTVSTSADAVYVVYWWGSLPLGASAYAREELPLKQDQLAALATDFLAEQLACRLPSLGGPPLARYDGRARLEPCLESAREVRPSSELLASLDLPPEDKAEDLAVVVCTRDRPRALRACLESLLAQTAPPGEILVVDNSSSESAGSVCQGLAGVRYLHQPNPGLSRARNLGLAAVSRPLVAFTDDDVEVHPHWSGELVRAFAGTDAECVTGLVIPASLDSESQQFFQLEMGAFGASFWPTRFDEIFFNESRHRGSQVWRIGAGANMAFRRALFERLGGFDERLGAGAAGCSEDSELWYRILASGGACLYEPRALVFHHHRDDWPELRRQMRAYMQGHVAALVAQYDRHGHPGNLRRIFNQIPRYLLRTGIEAFRNGRPQRGRVLADELRGWLSGLRYLARLGWRAQSAVAEIAPQETLVADLCRNGS